MNNKSLCFLWLGGFFLAWVNGQASSYTTQARQALLIDAQTGVVLFEKNADELMAPSSMTKIGTIYMVFKKLHEKSLSLETRFFVSERAWRMGGTRMFVETGTQVKVEHLIPGMIVDSGNDACVVVSEGISGTEETFVEAMNKTLRDLGAKTVHFKNASGLPEEGHTCSARDLATIALKTIEHFPDLYKKFYAQVEFTYNNITQRSLNPVLYAHLGGDGLKTGFTDKGGYGVVASVVTPKGRRLIMVINGLSSQKERKEEALKLLTHGLRAFDTLTIFHKGDPVDKADVWLGGKPSIQLAAGEDVLVTIDAHEREKLKVHLILPGPLPAPLKTGDHVGILSVTGSKRQAPFEVPVIAAEDVDKTGVLGRVKAALLYLLLGHNPQESGSEHAQQR